MVERDSTPSAVGGPEPGPSRETPEAPTLEHRLRRLEKIVRELETEELELDRALALFEEGVAHVREAEAALATAELKVQKLLGEDGELRVEPLEAEEGGEE